VADIGTRVLLKPGNPHQALEPSVFYLFDDANFLTENILQCRLTGTIGDTVSVLPGNHRGPVRDTV
jgi:hypothetical protein